MHFFKKEIIFYKLVALAIFAIAYHFAFNKYSSVAKATPLIIDIYLQILENSTIKTNIKLKTSHLSILVVVITVNVRGSNLCKEFCILSYLLVVALTSVPVWVPMCACVIWICNDCVSPHAICASIPKITCLKDHHVHER